jgi:hypothetical protein
MLLMTFLFDTISREEDDPETSEQCRAPRLVSGGIKVVIKYHLVC